MVAILTPVEVEGVWCHRLGDGGGVSPRATWFPKALVSVILKRREYWLTPTSGVLDGSLV